MKKNHKLIYDRKLEKGPGHPIYGIEVAKGMGLSSNFIELANKIRKEIMEVGSLLNDKRSRYHPELYMHNCSIPECKNIAEDTHHMSFQCTADNNDFIGHIHKNHRSNLIALCKNCHKMVHNTKIGEEKYIIKGYVTTTTGMQLQYEKIKIT